MKTYLSYLFSSPVKCLASTWQHSGYRARFRPNPMTLASRLERDRLPGNDCRTPIAILMGSSTKIYSTLTREERGEERRGGAEGG